MRECRQREAKPKVHLQRKDTVYVLTYKKKKTMFRREPTAKMLQNTSIIWIQEALQLIFWSDV